MTPFRFARLTKPARATARLTALAAFAFCATVLAGTPAIQKVATEPDPPNPSCPSPSYVLQAEVGRSVLAATYYCSADLTRPWAAIGAFPTSCHATQKEADAKVLGGIPLWLLAGSATGERFAGLQVNIKDMAGVPPTSSLVDSLIVIAKWCVGFGDVRANASKDAGLAAPGQACNDGTCPKQEMPNANGNPIQAGTGNKVEFALDYRGPGNHPLKIERTYNSGLETVGSPWGALWSGQFFQRLMLRNHSSGTYVIAVRPNGRSVYFEPAFGTYYADEDVYARLESGAGGGYVLRLEGDSIEEYDSQGRVLRIIHRSGQVIAVNYDGANALPASVVDAFGRTLTYAYGSDGRVQSVTDPGGGIYQYGYDAAGRLARVTYPDGASRTYQYELSGLPYALTGVTDENGTRYASFGYDASGMAASTEHAGGVSRFTFTYPNGRDAVMTDPSGAVSTLHFGNSRGSMLPQSGTIPCRSCGSNALVTYNGAGRPAATTNWNGVQTSYAHDTRGLQTLRVEASGRPEERRITTQWHASFRLPTRVAEPKRVTTNVYDADGGACGARGALCSRAIQATTDLTGAAGFGANPIGLARTWTYTYTASGRLLSVNGPRTDLADLTTYTYDAQGNLASVTNALGQTTRITAVDAHGQPLSIVDPNGVVTTLTYDARQRLLSRTVATETTQYVYDGVGQLTRVTLPDGTYVAYTYDAAHRLVALADNLGNRIAYTLDPAGNRVREDVLDPAGALVQTRQRVYDTLSRLAQEIGAQGQTTSYAYDAQGNVTGITDPLNRTTIQAYDGLNRLLAVTDPAAGITRYAYDGLDQLVAVTDPRNLTTLYTRTGLGDLELTTSPDTGATSNSFDAAGNLVASTDARGVQTLNQYDALNRLTVAQFGSEPPHTYVYDQGSNGIGRLSSVTHGAPGGVAWSATSYGYDALGRVTGEQRFQAGHTYSTSYLYDSLGRSSGMIYPSGRRVDYALDGLARIAGMSTTLASGAANVVSGVTYQPFGGVSGFAYGNGAVFSRAFDQDGRIRAYALGGAMEVIGFDPASRITSITRSGTQASYGYDTLDRLITATVPGGNYNYAYDPTGNRTARVTAAGTESYSTDAGSNRLLSVALPAGGSRDFAYEANGSPSSVGAISYAYDARGRVTSATSASDRFKFAGSGRGVRV